MEARIAFDSPLESRLVHVLVAGGVWKILSQPRFEKLRRSMLYNPGEGAPHRVRIGLEGRGDQGETIRRVVQMVDPEGQTGNPRWVPDCTDCQSGTPVPHWPSRRCDSGGRPHCTCDACF